MARRAKKIQKNVFNFQLKYETTIESEWGGPLLDFETLKILAQKKTSDPLIIIISKTSWMLMAGTFYSQSVMHYTKK